MLPVALLLFAAGVGLVAWKLFGLGYELVPTPARNRWLVQTEVRYRADGEKPRMTFFLPADRQGQKIYDERVAAEGVRFYIRPKQGNRVGLAVGTPVGEGVSYRFTLEAEPILPAELPATAPPLSAEETRRFVDELGADEAIQSDAPEVLRLVEELAVGEDEPAAAVKQLHEYVTRELELSDGHDGPQDAAAVLQRERGGTAGKARALVALLRAATVPARLVNGVPISEGKDEPLTHWVEAYVGGRWLPLDPVSGAAGALPEPRLVLHVGDAPHLEGQHVADVRYQVSMLREPGSAYAAWRRKLQRRDHWIDALSLHRLPVKTQVLLRVLLLVPLGALVVTIFRNLIGTPTFGTFMPILVALAFRETGLAAGLALLVVVVAFGWFGRSLLDRAQLLMVPRLSVMVTFVILIMTAIIIGAERLGSDRALSVALFPIVILTMTIERLSITLAEEGPRNAAKAVAGTLLVSIAGWAVIASETLQLVVFTFPELHLVTIAALLVLGRYTGYRLSEWSRFRAFRVGPGHES